MQEDLLIDILGYTSSAINTAAMFPQARIIYITSNTRSISLLMYIAIITAGIMWVIYGIMKKDWPIIVGNALSLGMSIYIFFKKIWNVYDTRRRDDVENE